MFGVGQRLQQLRPSGSGEPGNLVIEVLGLIVVKIVRGMSFNSAGGNSPVETNALNSGLPRRSRLKSPSTIRLVFQSDLRLAQASIHSLLDAHDAIVRVQLTRFRGREVSTSGASFLAMFDGPQRAIRCAMAIRDAVQALDIEVRAGLHTGECEVRGDDIGARVSALAGANDVLVSSTLRDLVIGSGLEFEERGSHSLKGVPGEWRVSAVV